MIYVHSPFPSRPLRVIQRKQLNIFFVKIAIRDLGCRTLGLHSVPTLSCRFFVSHWSLMTWQNLQKKLHPSTGMLERNNIKPLARVIYVSIEQRQKTVFVFFILTLRSFEWEWILCKSKLKHQEGDKKGLQKVKRFAFFCCALCSSESPARGTFAKWPFAFINFLRLWVLCWIVQEFPSLTVSLQTIHSIIRVESIVALRETYAIN